jgi:endonuclease G
MKQLFLSFVFLFAALPSYSWTQTAPLPIEKCQVHAPYGFPQSARQLTPVCRRAYFVGYDAAVKVPQYVMWTLTPQNALGCFPRTNAFVADASVPNGPKPEDYVGTGYDKGHMAPDGDMSWDQQVEYESFLMTNMAPQAGSLNRGAWKLLETSVRGWAVQTNNAYTILTGSVYNGNKYIGNGVVVPNAFYKIVINNNTKQVAAWWFPHTAPYPNLGNDLTKFRVPVAEITAKTGVKFGMPQGAVELQPGQEWPVNFGALTNAKRAKCGKSAD